MVLRLVASFIALNMPAVALALPLLVENILVKDVCRAPLNSAFDAVYEEEGPKRRQILEAGAMTSFRTNSQGGKEVVLKDKASGQILVRAVVYEVKETILSNNNKPVFHVSVPYVTEGLPSSLESAFLSGFRSLPVSAVFRYQLDSEQYQRFGYSVPFMRYLEKSSMEMMVPVKEVTSYKDGTEQTDFYVYFR